MFFKMRSPKKTVSLFQSHVFKHEFFLFPVPSDLHIHYNESKGDHTGISVQLFNVSNSSGESSDE